MMKGKTKFFKRKGLKYCQQTSLHGWQYIDSEQGLLHMVFWFFIILMSISLSIYFLIINTKAFLKATTVTSIDSTTASLKDLIFPSLYICNVNQVTKSFLKNLKVDKDDHAKQSLFDEFLTGKEVEDPINYIQKILEMTKKMKNIYNWNSYTRFLDVSSQNCSDMILGARWKSNFNTTFYDAFKTSTDYGACCLITPYLDLENPKTRHISARNYKGKHYHSIPKGLTRNGIQNGLTVMIDVESYDYGFFERGSEGLRVAIEDSRDKPVIRQNGFYVSPGTETLIALVPSVINTTQEAIDRFTPEQRNCYTDEEFRLKYFKYEMGFRYSMGNCLYESLLENILSNCNCIPNFVNMGIDIPYNDIDVCRGNKLECAINNMNNFGNDDMGLNKAFDTNNKSMTCFTRCDMQQQNLISTQSNYPNRQTFAARHDFCLILKKLNRVCKDPVRRITLEKYYETYDFFISCEQMQSKEITKICQYFDDDYEEEMSGFDWIEDDYDIYDEWDNFSPNTLILNESPYKSKLIEFLYTYASENIAILKVFYKDPYYTLFKKDEEMSTVSWIGNTGGLFGLCMGLSVVSIFEMLYHCFNFFLPIFKAH